MRSGFHRSHSTEITVVMIYNDIVLAFDGGFIIALLKFDFSASFDCFDHNILCRSSNINLVLQLMYYFE